MKDIELLSPAGGMEALHAAVQNGADAVYLGEKSFSARSSAENFGEDSLKEAVAYAHERGTKVYLAMNTLVKDGELKGFEKGVHLAAECGVDALIIQDFGAAHVAKAVCPDMPIHASTQMSAHNEADVTMLLERGFSRVVLARELKEREIEKIYRNTKAELEVFVHGALCVCVSGQCLMSSFIGGRSGNRGRCAQPCRQLYTAEGKKGYFLSPRDLCLIEELDSLEKIGVKSLKIEGRMKSAEYVATVTGMYRKYLDNPGKVTKEDIRELERIFVRGDGFTKAYYKDINTPEMMNYSLSNDGISYRSDKEILKKAANTYREGVENKKVFVTGFFALKKNEEAFLSLSDGENVAFVKGSVPEEAINLPLDEKSATERLKKLGQTPYVLSGLTCEIDEGLTISAKDINQLRRECTEKLSEMRREVKPLKINEFDYEYKRGVKKDFKIAVSVINEEQLRSTDKADIVYMPLSLFEKSEKDERFVVALPKVLYDVDAYVKRLKVAGAKRVLVSTYGTLKRLQQEGFECIGDYGLNVFNALSCNEYENAGIKHVTLSPELSADEISAITEKTDAECEVLAYGRMLMMTTRACIVKGVRGRCDCDRPLVLRDKTGAGFAVYSDKAEHINMIYNTSVTFTADKMNMLKRLNASYLRLVFTDETGDRVRDVIDMYSGKKEAELPKSFTRGYFTNKKKHI